MDVVARVPVLTKRAGVQRKFVRNVPRPSALQRSLKKRVDRNGPPIAFPVRAQLPQLLRRALEAHSCPKDGHVRAASDSVAPDVVFSEEHEVRERPRTGERA